MKREAASTNAKPYQYVSRAHERPVIDQGDPNETAWIEAGGDPRDRGRMIELITRDLSGAQHFMLGLAWFEPGDTHLLHHHPHADEWYYVISGSAEFTVGEETVRGEAGTALFIPAGVGHRIHNDGQEILHIAWGFNRSELKDVGIVWDE
jgi:oxalate decarboxylase/phosphoglucose isomerase-like protein (cupin superfamily)